MSNSDMEQNATRMEFDNLVHFVWTEVLTYTKNLCHGNTYLADDLMMEAYLVVLKNFPLIKRREPIAFKTYFRRSVKNQWRKYWTLQSSRYESIERLLESGYDIAAESWLEESETGLYSPIVARALGRLTSDERAAILLDADGQPAQKAAQSLHVTMHDYKSSLAVAKAKMREWIMHGDQGDTVSVDEWAHGPSEDIDAATSSYSVKDIARLLHTSQRWVIIQLAECDVTAVKPVALRSSDDKPRYPEDALAKLRARQADTCFEVPEAGTFLNLSDLTKLTRRSRLWIKNRLSLLGIESELRQDKAGRKIDYWPPEVIDKLQLANTTYHPADDWMSIGAITSKFGYGRDWVERILEEINAHAEPRVAPGSKTVNHYHPEVVEQLHARAAELKDAGDWMTANAISVHLGRSRTWILRRLEPYRRNAEWRRDPKGATRLHYPPDVIATLRQDKLEQDDRRQNVLHHWSKVNPADALLTNLREQARVLGRPPKYTDLRAAERNGTGIPVDKLYDHWESINGALQAAGLLS